MSLDTAVGADADTASTAADTASTAADTETAADAETAADGWSAESGLDAAAPTSRTDAVVVRLGAGRYAIELPHVAEVGKAPPLTRVPGTPSWLAGVANWRGRILPVVDLRSLLGAEPAAAGPTPRLVVLSTEAATVGLLVDAVDGTTCLGAEVEPVPATIAAARADLVRGQLPRADGPLAVLDVPAVMALRDALPRG